MSVDVSETLENKKGDGITADTESPYMEYDSDEFTDWSEDDDISQNLDEDLESNFSEKRYSGDGEEQPSGFGERNQKQFDDDEDKKNPAYVPRKGSFFEHDLRRGGEDCCRADVGVRKIKEKNCEHRRRGLWSYDHSRWEHDRFDERSQRPKSVHELVTIYGFNIRKDSRAVNPPKRFGLRNKTMRPSYLNGSLNKRSPSIRVGRSRKESLQTFIIVENKEDTKKVPSRPCSAGSVKSSDRHSLDFEDIRGTNRFIEEPIICFAPKRGEKVDALQSGDASGLEVRGVPYGSRSRGEDENEPDLQDESSHAGEFVFDPEVFRRGSRHFGVPRRRKKYFAGSGRLAPILGGYCKKFSRNSHDYPQDEQDPYSPDEINGGPTTPDHMERHWKSRTSGYDHALEGRRHRASFSQFRGAQRSGFRGRCRARNYYHEGTFPQDVRLIVMCGSDAQEEETNPMNADNCPERSTASSSSLTLGVRKNSMDKALVVTSQGGGGLISDILPPVTCCARTRSNRSSADPPVYTFASALHDGTSTTATNTTTTTTGASISNPPSKGSHTQEPEAEGSRHQEKSKMVEEDNLSKSSKSDLLEDRRSQVSNDKRYSTNRTGSDVKARSKPSFNPRFPAPPRNRIFHPNAFNSSTASSFLPAAAFILPTGPMFPGPHRHSSMPHGPSSMGRNVVPSMLGLNSHHNPSSHPHQLLALPVRVTPVPFILASSQALSLPSSQHLQSQIASAQQLHLSSKPSTSCQSAISNATASSSSSSPSSTSSSSSIQPSHLSDSTNALSSTSTNAVISRPTSLFQAGPPRNTPHPKHWFRFNAKHCTFLKHVPSFHHHQMQYRQSFPNPVAGSVLTSKRSSTSNSMVSSMGRTVTTLSVPQSTSPAMATSSIHSSSCTPPTDVVVAASKLSPHAAAFMSSKRTAEGLSEDRDGVSAKMSTGSLYEVIPVHSRYWQRSHKACPIEVRGGTVYFSPELQQFQYRCCPSTSRKAGIHGFVNGEVICFDPEGKISEIENAGRTKKALSIVDPKSVKGNELEGTSYPDGVEGAPSSGSTDDGSVELPLENQADICQNDVIVSISTSLNDVAICADDTSKILEPSDLPEPSDPPEDSGTDPSHQ